MSTKILPIGRDWLIHKGDIIAPITETGFMKAGVWKMNGASQTLDESGWQKVNLPHDFVIEGDFCRSRDRFIGNVSDIPAMEDDQQLSLRLDVTLSNGQTLTDSNGTWTYIGGELLSAVG